MKNKVLLMLLILGIVSVLVFFLINSGKKNIQSNNVDQGVSKSEILIGSSLAKTGLISFLGLEYERGAEMYFNKVNDAGGVFGRKIKLITYDDGYIPAKTIQNIQKLLVDDGVFAFVNFVGSPNGAKAMPMLEEVKVPLVGIFSGAKILRQPLNKYIFNIRPSYYEETEYFAKGAVDQLKLKKVAIFYQNDDFGLDGLNGMRIALKNRGITPVAEASYNRGTLNIEPALKTISESGAEAVAMIATYSQAAKFISMAKEQGFNPVFLCLSVVGPEEFAKTLGEAGDGVVVTQILPPPFSITDPNYNPTSKGVLNEYAQDLNKYFPEASPSFGSLEGYINAKVLVEGLKNSGVDPSREKLIEALEKLNLGLEVGTRVIFSPANHQGMNILHFTYIKNNKFISIDDLNQIPR
jgi:ABC-type branched-subunit amino acid transport system substrate-binding protein